ncbi:MAG: protein kinase [Victivallaceae bacterium]|nr:protein kinase [Victivallaceae bacterium]
MRFQCPNCKDIISAPDGQYGKKVTCPHCNTPTATPESAFGSGMAIGDFIIIRQLGAGGAGVVYLAHQISLDRPAALKILRSAAPDQSDDPVQDLIREARSAAKLNHPNIVQAYAVGEDAGVFYFAMEYIDGETMKSVLKREGSIDAKRAADIVRQIAGALQFAWDRQKLTHRDIKPDNIMYTSNGQAKLADLGLSRRAGEHSEEDDSDEVMGTPQYISPEQLTGAPVDTRSDIYSLGATFYQFVTGRFPYEGPDVNEIAKQHVIGNLTPPREVNYNVPEEISRIIVKMMARYPEQRYQSPGEVAKALEAFIRPPATGGAAAASAGGLRSAALDAQAQQAQAGGATLSGGGLRQGGMTVLAAPSSGGTSLKGVFHRPDHSQEEKEVPHTIGLGIPTSLNAEPPDQAHKTTLKLGQVSSAPENAKSNAVMPKAAKKSNSGVVAMIVILIVAAIVGGIFMYAKQQKHGGDSGKPSRNQVAVAVDDELPEEAAESTPAEGGADDFSEAEIAAVLTTPIPITGGFEDQLLGKYMNFANAACQAAREDNVAVLRLLARAVTAERSDRGSRTPLEQRSMFRVLDTCNGVLRVLADGRRVKLALDSGAGLVGMQFAFQGKLHEVDSVADGKFNVHVVRQSEPIVIALADMNSGDRNRLIEAIGERIGVAEPLYGFLFYNLRFQDLAGMSSTNLTGQQQMEFERMYFRCRLKIGGAQEEAVLRNFYGGGYSPLLWAIRNPLP